MKKKIALGFIIAALLLLCGISVSAETDGTYIYTIENGEATITGVVDKSSFSGKQVIPNTIDGYLVTSIGRGAFEDCSELTDISIPNGVTTIGNSAFYWCSNLTSVTIPENVTIINSYTFFGCGLRSINIPNKVTKIDNNAFTYCKNLSYVGISDSVKNIEYNAFIDCPNIRTIILPKDVYIGYEAFSCKNATILYRGTEWEWQSKGLEYSLENFIPDTGESYKIYSSVEFDYKYTYKVTFLDYDGSFLLETFVKENSEAVYTGNPLTRPEDENGKYCFAGWDKSLDNITDNLIVTAQYRHYCIVSFVDYNGNVLDMQEIKVGGNVNYQGPDISRTEIDSKILIFVGWDKSLENIISDTTITAIYETYYNVKFINADKTVLYNQAVKANENAVYKGNTPTITDPYYFCEFIGWNKSLKNITTNIVIEAQYNYSREKIIDGVTYTINNGKVSVKYSNNLSSIRIEEYVGGYPVVQINDFAFYDCGNLFSVILPNTLKYIGSSTFYKCTNLREIIIPPNVSSIGNNAFSECKSLSKIKAPANLSSTESQWRPNDTVNIEYYNCCTVEFVGDYEETKVVEQGTTVDTPVAPIGYTYNFTVNGSDWNKSVITSDIIITVTKSINKYQITFDGDYQETQFVEYNNYATLPNAPYGYNYIFTVGNIPWISMPITGDITITVTKMPIKYKVQFIGDYEETQNIDYGTKATLPTAPIGYIYTYTVNGVAWNNEPITDNITITVTKTIIKHNVTFVGAYTSSQTVEYGKNATLPTAPTGYVYTYTANGTVWNNEPITDDITITVTKKPIKYQVNFVGAYEETQSIDYNTKATLPIAPTGYIYTYTVNGAAWKDEPITSDITITVTKLCDLAEISSINLENNIILDNAITGKYYKKSYVPQIVVSNKASYIIYSDSALKNAVNTLTLSKGINTFYIKVTAESGRAKVYTLTINRDIPDTLGTLTVKQTVGNSMILTTKNAIVGTPDEVKVLYGTSQNNMTNKVTAVFNPENQTIYITGLPEGMTYYFKVQAIYDEITIESSIIYEQTGTALSSDCYVLNMLSPAGGTIDHESGTISDLRVTSKFESVKVDAEVSPKATWDLYYTKTSSKKYADKTLPLSEGHIKTAYIRVVAEDGTEKAYSISIYRQTKSVAPEIKLNGKLVSISAPENSDIIYTVDGTEPSEVNGKKYTSAFSVSAGTVIKAIAKQTDKDEYSDIAVYSVADSVYAEIIPIEDVYKSNGKIYYDFFVEATGNISGSFMMAVYDKSGRLVKLNTLGALSDEAEKDISGYVTADNNAYTYKAFLWSDLENIKPLAKAVSGVIGN